MKLILLLRFDTETPEFSTPIRMSFSRISSLTKVSIYHITTICRNAINRTLIAKAPECERNQVMVKESMESEVKK